jgi:hypothetical protein
MKVSDTEVLCDVRRIWWITLNFIWHILSAEVTFRPILQLSDVQINEIPAW